MCAMKPRVRTCFCCRHVSSRSVRGQWIDLAKWSICFKVSIFPWITRSFVAGSATISVYFLRNILGPENLVSIYHGWILSFLPLPCCQLDSKAPSEQMAKSGFLAARAFSLFSRYSVMSGYQMSEKSEAVLRALFSWFHTNFISLQVWLGEEFPSDFSSILVSFLLSCKAADVVFHLHSSWEDLHFSLRRHSYSGLTLMGLPVTLECLARRFLNIESLLFAEHSLENLTRSIFLLSVGGR